MCFFIFIFCYVSGLYNGGNDGGGGDRALFAYQTNKNST
jgi:hypothetical protein